jgi:CrcB protein
VILLVVAIGGALGSVCRYVLSGLVLRSVGTLFPAGTFVVNIVGCLLFGLIAGGAQQRFTISADTRAFVFAGFLGGFTTFSSYMNESVALVHEGRFLLAALNLGGQVVAGFVTFLIGFSLATL